MATQYAIDRFAHLRVGPDCLLVGLPRDSLDLGQRPGLNVITTVEAATGRPTSTGRFDVGDTVTMTGHRGDIEAYALEHGLSVEDMLNREQSAAALVNAEHGIAEVVVPPRSRMVGETVRPGHVTAAGWVVLAVQRQGVDRGPATTVLEVGDTLLVEGR